ncbi:MAG: UDP-N-acetylglucosamine 1-carboxyvinyltransferase [Patescibacteria group bacterium]|nr:UDP-N-acetylglucosamine 1-carboxyvinyltransferase [Patescibacteria group bacterium]MDE2116399.1 UDP-N-acetylglucosamine 1-carboxyvinyltransferase [Patescibacteria group bacterium]
MPTIKTKSRSAKAANAKAATFPALASIGAMIARLREDRHMTQTELGDKIGTTQSVIARIEKGEQNLSTETLAKLSEALNHEIVQLSKGGTVNFRIEGDHKLKGAITVRTSKNGAVGVMCAALLNQGTTTIKNTPRIEEVNRIVEVFESIGVRVEWAGNDLRITPPATLRMRDIHYDSAAKTRSVVMMIGSLVHRLKKFDLPQASGCTLGSRTIKPYIYALEKLGVLIETSSRYYHVSRESFKKNREIIMYEAGDTVTEAVLMAVALIPGTTTIKFASANYQVQDVAFYLEKLGVKIDGIGTSTMVVHGIDAGPAGLKKDVEYFLSEDPIEAMSLIAAAIVTNSSITIERCPIDFLELELLKLEKMGFKYKILKRYKADNGATNLIDIETKPSRLKALDEKIHALPYPGINMDNLPFFAVIGAVAEGETFIHDWTYEERAIYYKELGKLRAETILADPHRFYIKGPTRFKAAEIVCPPALRPSVIILIAMLAAEGTSILRNVYNINRGYEDLAARLNSIGAKIEVFRDL